MKKLILLFLLLCLASPAQAWQQSWRSGWGGGGSQLAIPARGTDVVYISGNTDTPAGQLCTITAASPAVVAITEAANSVLLATPSDGTPVTFFNVGGALPTGLTAGTTYYVKATYANYKYTLKIYTDASCAAQYVVNTSAAGSGINYIRGVGASGTRTVLTNPLYWWPLASASHKYMNAASQTSVQKISFFWSGASPTSPYAGVTIPGLKISSWSIGSDFEHWSAIDSITYTGEIKPGLNTLTLSRPLIVPIGGSIGIDLPDTTTLAVNPFCSDTYNENSNYSVGNLDGRETEITGGKAILTGGGAIPIRLEGQAPMIVHIGDSITSGVASSWLNPLGEPREFKTTNFYVTKNFDRTTQAVSQIEDILGMSYINLGINGEASTATLARFPVDVINRKPKYAIISIGVNDLNVETPDTATLISNITGADTGMVALCVNAGIIPIVTAIHPVGTPLASGFDPRVVIQTTNVSLKSAVATYPTAIWIDSSDKLGDYTGGETPHYTMKALYDTNDHLHINHIGQVDWGQDMASQLYAKLSCGGSSTWGRRW